jgi:hypothetical protein
MRPAAIRSLRDRRFLMASDPVSAVDVLDRLDDLRPGRVLGAS